MRNIAMIAKGGCANSRLDHTLKFYSIQEGCGSSRLIHGFSDSVLHAQGCFLRSGYFGAVREFVNKSAASAASLDYVKFQAVIKLAASAVSLAEAALAVDLITALFLQLLAVLAAQK